MPTKKYKPLTQRYKNFEAYRNCGNSSNVLMYFFKMVFRSFDALKVIVLHFIQLMRNDFELFIFGKLMKMFVMFESIVET
jgi:hypothetical protein